MGRARFLLLLCLSLVSCAPDERPLAIGAAASLREVVTEAAAAFAASQGVLQPVLALEASSTIARQVNSGAQLDLFLSADVENVERAGSRIDAAEVRVFLTNELVIATRADLDESPSTPEQWAASEFTIGLAGEEVPAGRYARAYLRQLGLEDAFAGRVAIGSNVRGTLALLETGAVDAVFVYRTDALLTDRARIVHTAPQQAAAVRYFAAPVKPAHPDLAEFLVFLSSEEFREIAAKHGFVDPR